jgi:hypothetical protein
LRFLTAPDAIASARGLGLGHRHVDIAVLSHAALHHVRNLAFLDTGVQEGNGKVLALGLDLVFRDQAELLGLSTADGPIEFELLRQGGMIGQSFPVRADVNHFAAARRGDNGRRHCGRRSQIARLVHAAGEKGA